MDKFYDIILLVLFLIFSIVMKHREKRSKRVNIFQRYYT